MSQKQQGTVGPVAGEGEGEVEGGGGGRRESGSSQAAGGDDNGAAGNGDRDQGRTSSSSAAATDGQQSGAGAGAGAGAGGSRVVQDQGGGMDGVDDDDDDDDEAKPQIPRRQFKPVKGVVDRHGRRNALDFGMPPERELEKPSRLDILYPKPKKKKQDEAKATSKSPDEEERLAGEVERLKNIADQMKQLTEAELREQVDALKEELAKAKEKVGKRLLLQEVRRRASLRMDVISALQEDGQLLVPAGAGVGAAPPEQASADQSGAEAGAAIDVTKLGDAIEEGEEGDKEEDKEGDKEGEDGENGEGDKDEDEDEDEETPFAAAPEEPKTVHLQEELEQHLPKQEYKGPPRPRSTLQNAVGWFVRRRDGYYIAQEEEEEEAGEAGAGDASGPAGSGLSAVMARKKPENRGERRAEDYRRMKPKQRRNRAATSIQRCFRVFQMHRKFYILTNKKRRDELARLGVDPFETEQFGPDSLAKRKPIEVAKYLKDNKIENFIVEQVKGFLTQPNLSTNPYPELLIRMRMRQIIDTEFLRIGYRDEDYHKKFVDNADNVQERNREGQLLAAAYFTNLEPTRTFWGEKHMMQVVDALALDQIRNALGPLVDSKVRPPPPSALCPPPSNPHTLNYWPSVEAINKNDSHY